MKGIEIVSTGKASKYLIKYTDADGIKREQISEIGEDPIIIEHPILEGSKLSLEPLENYTSVECEFTATIIK